MKVLSEIAINSNTVLVNGNVLFQSDTDSALTFFKELYLAFKLDYPKFYKMDEISKLYFLGVELLLTNSSWSSDHGSKTTLVAGTTTGCLSSDKKHLESILSQGDSLPSPAIFVYTLPNIMLGEVCIRHGITGENTCFIIPPDETSVLDDYARILMAEKDTEFCIKGYVNFHPKNYECYLSLLSKV